MRDLLLALFWMIAIPLSFLSPVAGVSFWVWDALFSPTELAYSFMVSIPTNRIAALATLLGVFSKRKEWDLYLDRTGLLLLLFGISATLSWATAIIPWEDDAELYLKVLKEIVLSFTLMYLIKSQRWMHVLIFIIVISISFFGVKEGLISLLTVGGHKIIGSRAIGDNNQLAAAIIVILPLMIFLYKHTQNRIVCQGLLVALFLNVITVIMTLSRGGFVGLVVLAFLYLTRSKQRLRAILVILVLACVLYILAPQAWFTRVDTINDATDDSSFMGRVIAWKISWLLAKDHPFFGGGFHAIQYGYVWFRYSLRLPELDWLPTPPPDLFPHAAHSLIFEVLGDLGFIGFGIYSLLFLLSYSSLNKVDRLAGDRENFRFAADLAQSMKFSLILYLITGLLLSVAYFELIFVLFALSSRCLRNVRQMTPNLEKRPNIPKIKDEAAATAISSPGARPRRYSL